MTKLQKNVLYNMAYQILLIILPLITAPYVSRVLGVNGVGTYSYIYSIAYYFCLFGMLGISNHGNRSIALVSSDKQKTAQIFWSIYTLQFITTFTAMVVYIVFVAFFFDGNKTIAYIDVLFLLSYVLDINWLFFGLEEFKLTVTRNMVFKFITVGCIFIFVKDADDLWKYTLIMALGTTLSQIYLWLFIHKKICFIKPNIKSVFAQLKPTLVLFVPVLAYSIYKVMDKIMLGSMSSIQQVGLYENAEKIIGIPVGIMTAFGTVMMPRISALTAENNSTQIGAYNKMSFKYFTVLEIGMVAGLIGISNIFPEVYFGVEFIDCGPLIAGLSLTLIFMTWANIIRTQYLMPKKRDKPYVVSTISGAILNFIVNFILIPLYGGKGALVGTVLAEFSVFLIQTIYVIKEFPVIRYIKPTLPFFGFGAIMGVVVYYIGMISYASIITLFVQILVGGVLYILLSGLYMVITKDQLLISVIHKIKKSLI